MTIHYRPLLTSSEREAAATIADYAARLQKQTELTEAAIEDAAREYERAETWCERERVARVAMELAEQRAKLATAALAEAHAVAEKYGYFQVASVTGEALRGLS